MSNLADAKKTPSLPLFLLCLCINYLRLLPPAVYFPWHQHYVSNILLTLITTVKAYHSRTISWQAAQHKTKVVDSLQGLLHPTPPPSWPSSFTCFFLGGLLFLLPPRMPKPPSHFPHSWTPKKTSNTAALHIQWWATLCLSHCRLHWCHRFLVHLYKLNKICQHALLQINQLLHGSYTYHEACCNNMPRPALPAAIWR